MYVLQISTRKIEKRLNEFIQKYPALIPKLKRLQENPRKTIDAHPLHGEFRDYGTAI